MKVKDLLNGLKKVRDDIVSAVGNEANNAKNYLTPQTGGLARSVQNFWQTPVQVSQPVDNFVNKITSIPQTISNWQAKNWERYQQPVSAPLQPIAKFAINADRNLENYVKNTYISSAKDIPQAFGQIINPRPLNIAGWNVPKPINRVIGAGRLAIDALGSVPDPTDIPVAAFNYAKGARASYIRGGNIPQNINAGIQSMTLEKPVGLGEALTTNEAGSTLGNLAELPLMIFGGMSLSKRKAFVQSFTKDIDKIDAVIHAGTRMDKMSPHQWINTANGIDPIVEKYLPWVKKDKTLMSMKSKGDPRYYSIISDSLQDIKTRVLNPSQMWGSVVQPKNGPDALVGASKQADLLSEARKYKSAEEFIQKVRGGATQYGDYTPEMRVGGLEGYKNISKLGIKPEEKIIIYRGIDDVTGKVKRQINEGDFVTTDFESALSYTGNPKDVVSMEVPAKYLYVSEPKDFLSEPFYTGAEYVYTKGKQQKQFTDIQLTDIYNQAKGGAISPLSQQSTKPLQSPLQEGKKFQIENPQSSPLTQSPKKPEILERQIQSSTSNQPGSSFGNNIPPKEQLGELYRQAGDAFGEAHYQVLTELEMAQAGKRFKAGENYTGTNSTFPQWIPEGLRDKKLLNKIMDNILDYENIVYPKQNTKESMLQNIVLDRIETQAGIDGKSLRRAAEAPIVKQTKSKTIKITGPVFNAEPSQRNIKLRNINLEKKIANQDYKEWQRQLFSQEGATQTKNKQLETQLKRIEEKIKQNTSVGGISADELKDLSGFNAQTRDVYRNFRSVYGNKFENIKRTLLDPFDQAKGNLSRSFNNWAGRINKEVEINLGIKKGSKESAAVQLFGEGKLNNQQLVDQFGTKKAAQIVEADKWFRTEYDKLLNEVNGVMARIYPNNPEKIIPKRQDYYRHFREMGNGITGLLNIFDSPSNISSSLSGTSEFVRPKSKWLSFAQKRLGGQSDIDAVGGFIDYVKAAEYNKNIDPFTNQFRKLAEDLAIQTENNPRLNNFIEYLHDFANDLAGKTNPADRFVQKILPGGRKTMSVINWLNNRVKANTILSNLSSSVAQIFNVPQGIADAGLKSSTKGLGYTVANIFGEATPITKSDFITERYGGGVFDRFDRTMIANLKKGAAWITSVLDEVGTKYIWNSEYAKAVSQGVQNPIKFADDATRLLVAGRGIGEVPLVQKSKIFQLVAPFQLEVGNLWHVMGDWVGEKQFGKLVTFFVASYVFNQGAKAIRGSDVSFDPIQASIDAYNTLSTEENKGMGVLKAGGRLTGEVLSNIPLLQNVAASYPEYGFKVGEMQMPTRSEFFGEGDPTRFGSGLLLTKGLQDPLFKIIPPFGGQQIKRTIEGIDTTLKGYSDSPTGRIRFPVETDPLRNIQRAVFGEYSTPAARNYFDSNASVLGEKQSQTFKDLQKESPQKSKEYYDDVIKRRNTDNIIDKEKETLKDSSDNMIKSKTGVYLVKQDNGDIETIDISKPLEAPKLTGNYELDKKLKSQYKGEITSRATDIVKLYKAGQLSDSEAESMLKELTTLKSKVSGGGTLKIKSVKLKAVKMSKIPKAKKIKLAKINFPKIKTSSVKISSPKVKGVKLAKIKKPKQKQYKFT